jgi:signal transduction histidine kinase
MTWWFRVIAVSFLALLSWFIIRSDYSRKLEKERTILERQQAIEQERTRIATDMHDDFGASLSRIKFISEKIQFMGPSDEVLKNDLGKISAFSDEMAEKMNEIVWALNQRNDSIEDLVSFSRAYAADYLQDKGVALHFSSSIRVNGPIQGEIRRNVFMVIKEALHNITKHASASTATIEFSEEPGQLKVLIRDDGVGIDFDSIRPFANGLENMKKRMEGVGGQVRLAREAGTVVEIRVPL